MPASAPRCRPAVQEQPHRRAAQPPSIPAAPAGAPSGPTGKHLSRRTSVLPAGRQHPQRRGGAQQRPGQPWRTHPAGARSYPAPAGGSQTAAGGKRLKHRHVPLLPNPQRLHHLRRDQPWIGDTGELGQPHAVREPLYRLGGRLQGQPGLTGPARPGERDQPCLA